MHLGQSVFMECADMSVTIAFGPNWSAEQAYGKMDPIATFSHVSREMTFNLVLLAKTETAAMNQQRDIDRFIKFQYPKYKPSAGGATLSAPPFFKVNVLNDRLYSAVEGYITAFEATPGSQEDVAPLVGGDKPFFYERKWTINFTMTVLHDEVVGWLGAKEPGNQKGFVFIPEALSTPYQQHRTPGVQGSGFGPQGSGMGPTQTSFMTTAEMARTSGGDGDTSVSDAVSNVSTTSTDQAATAATSEETP